MIKTVSVAVTESSRDATAVAADMAPREDAHFEVICLGIEPLPVEAIAKEMQPVALAWSAAEAQTRAEVLAAWSRSALSAAVPASVRAMTAPGMGLAPTVGQAARLSDLVVLARPYRARTGVVASVLAEALLFAAGVPVLAMPDADPTNWSRSGRRICLAWNESDDAMRAVRGALPFLQSTEAVDIAVINPPPMHSHDWAESAESLCLWLSRHGVKAEIAFLPQTELRVADILTRFVRERGCEALVMGAIGHSRPRELVLDGGYTGHTVRSAPAAPHGALMMPGVINWRRTTI